MKTILIDLDGTLLGMNQAVFINDYFKELVKKFHYIDSKLFMKAMMAGVDSMVNDNNSLTNEEKFWNVFTNIVNMPKETLVKDFEDFYLNEFKKCVRSTYRKDDAKVLIDLLKEKGYDIILATNPLFPKIATYTRLDWAGLKPSSFKEITTYENYYSCKPNLNYFKQILDEFNLTPAETVMIGNDANEDLVAGNLVMDVYLVNDDLINPDNKELNCKFVGSLQELIAVVKNL